MEERVARIEGILEQVVYRLNHMEKEMAELRARIDSHFRWTIGILITMWVTIILSILAIVFTVLL